MNDIEIDNKIHELETALNALKDIVAARNEKPSDKEADKETDKEPRLTPVEMEKIDNIMRDFDFELVHKVMTHLGWRWVRTTNGVPTVDELKTSARRLLVDVVNEKCRAIATGGLRAVCETEGPDDPDPYIALEFVAEECEGFTNDGDDENAADTLDELTDPDPV